MNTQDPHDALFKVTFTILEVMEEFIEKFLPTHLVKHLDLNTLQMSVTEHVDNDLRKHFSDIIYRCFTKNEKLIEIVLLLEHKSYVPEYPHIQPLRYLVNSYDEQTKRVKGEALKKPILTIPIILYHGKNKWLKKDFATYFDLPHEDFRNFIPSFDYLLIDLAKYDDGFIEALETGYLATTFLLFKHYYESDYLESNVRKIFINIDRYKDAKSGINFFHAALFYYGEITNFEKPKYRKIIKKLPKFMETPALSTWGLARRDGKLEGKIEGKIEGRREEKQEITLKCFRHFPDWTDKEVADFVELPIATVKKLRKKYLNEQA